MEAKKEKQNEFTLEALKKMGLPLSRVVFHDTITSKDKDNLPEFAMYASHPKKNREAKIWYTPHGVLLQQRGGHKIIPLANVKDTDLI